MKDDQFTVDENHVWSKYREELRDRYKPYLYTEVTDGKHGEIFVTEELCHELLHADVNFADMERNPEIVRMAPFL